MNITNLNVAIIHYWFVSWRGGEKVIASLLKIFPNADIYTLFYDEKICGEYLKNHRVYSSVLNKPYLRKHYQKIFPLYPLGIRSLRLQKKYDLIISSESGPAKGIDNPNHIPHVCYVHTPMRYCWENREPYLKTIPYFLRSFVSWNFEKLKKWDETTINNVDYYIANSKNVAKRILKHYKKQSEICYPPIDLSLFQKKYITHIPIQNRKFYLSFGALTPYKNIDLLIEVFNQNQQTLKVIGTGSELERLKKKSHSNIQFLGNLPDEKLHYIIQNAKALIFPGEEDFGMIPLEVMAHGIPVIALQKGGAIETVIENQKEPEKSTGVFFKETNINSLLEGLKKFEKIQHAFSPKWIQNHARKFGEDIFLQRFTNILQSLDI